jgi:hypothetical protein
VKTDVLVSVIHCGQIWIGVVVVVVFSVFLYSCTKHFKTCCMLFHVCNFVSGSLNLKGAHTGLVSRSVLSIITDYSKQIVATSILGVCFLYLLDSIKPSEWRMWSHLPVDLHPGCYIWQWCLEIMLTGTCIKHASETLRFVCRIVISWNLTENVYPIKDKCFLLFSE